MVERPEVGQVRVRLVNGRKGRDKKFGGSKITSHFFLHRITSASLRRYKKKKKKKKNEIRQQRTCKIRRGRIIIKSGRAVSGVYTADELRPDIVTSTRGGRQKIYTIKKVKAKRKKKKKKKKRLSRKCFGCRSSSPRTNRFSPPLRFSPYVVT